MCCQRLVKNLEAFYSKGVNTSLLTEGRNITTLNQRLNLIMKRLSSAPRLLSWSIVTAIFASLCIHALLPAIYHRPTFSVVEARSKVQINETAPQPEILTPDRDENTPEEFEDIEEPQEVEKEPEAIPTPTPPTPMREVKPKPKARKETKQETDPEPKPEIEPEAQVDKSPLNEEAAENKKDPSEKTERPTESAPLTATSDTGDTKGANEDSRIRDAYVRGGQKNISLAERIAARRKAFASRKERTEAMRQRMRDKAKKNQSYQAANYPALAQGDPDEAWACNANDRGIKARVQSERPLSEWVTLVPFAFKHFPTRPSLLKYTKKMAQVTGRKKQPVKRIGPVEMILPREVLRFELESPQGGMLYAGRSDARCIIGLKYRRTVFMPMVLKRVPIRYVQPGKQPFTGLVNIEIDDHFNMKLESVDEQKLPFIKGRFKNADRIVKNIEGLLKKAESLKNLGKFFGYDYEEKMKEKRKKRRKQRKAARTSSEALKALNRKARTNPSKAKSSQSHKGGNSKTSQDARSQARTKARSKAESRSKSKSKSKSKSRSGSKSR